MRCSPFQDGTGFATTDGYTRIHQWNGMTTSQQAMSVKLGPEDPTMER